MSVEPVQALPIEQLRQRTSAKWVAYPEDVLPLFVAETDFALAPTVQAALQSAIDKGDTGYTADHTPLNEVFVDFAKRRWGWVVETSRIRSTADVSMAIVEILRRVTSPGDGVVVTTPVYPPFFDLIAEAGAVVERVSLCDDTTGWRLDLDGIDAALAAGARAVLLCNPHNPTGTVHSREDLAGLAAIAERHGVAVISDEIHAPLTRPGVQFTPFLAASAAAARVGYAVMSASKAFNLAGLKCALMVTADATTASVVRAMPDEVQWRTGQFGMLAAVAAYSPASDEWLDGLLLTLEHNRTLLNELLSEHLPAARWLIPDAGYLAWIDFSAFGWGDDPARRILEQARVALHFGPQFGAEGQGFARLNFGTSPEILREAIRRIAAIVAEPSSQV